MHKELYKLIVLALALAAAVGIVAATASAQTAAPAAVIVKVFSGITTAQTSASVRNTGQIMHLVSVIFPAETTEVTGLQVRIEASFDGALWFPISRDITSAPMNGTRAYTVANAYGVWPYIRVRSLTSTGGKAMHVYYSGHMVPAVTRITQEADRLLL